MIRYIGLDVHKDSIAVAALSPAGEILDERRINLTEVSVEQFAAEYLRGEDRVVLEATFHTWALVERLRPHAAQVVVSNPLQTKAIAQAKIKTDKVDALVLAHLLRCDFIPEVWQPDALTQKLRRLHARRASLVGDRIRIKNRLHAVLHQRLLRCPAPDLFSVKGLAWLRAVPLDEDGAWLRDSDLRLLEHVEKELGDLEQRLCEMAYEQEQVKLLMTLPGVDVRVAQTLLSAWGDIDRFSDGAKAASYLGLAPSVHQSGERCYHGSITKAGRGHARWLLIQAAQCVGRHPGPLGVYFKRLKRRKNHNVAVVATARKLAVIAWYMLRRNEPYRYALPKSTEQKLGRLRVKATGAKRKTGPAKGSAKPAAQEQPTRKVRSLDEVYESEGLPPRAELAAGEQQMLQERELTDWVETLSKPQREKRARKAKKPPETRSTQKESTPKHNTSTNSTQKESTQKGSTPKDSTPKGSTPKEPAQEQ